MTTPDPEQGEVDHLWPEILPGGEAVLFTIVANPIEDSQIAVLSLDTREQTVLIRGGSFPRYSPTGHLLYGVQGNLWAVGFDLNRLETVGDPVPVQEGVLTKPQGAADFSVSENGSLVYVAGAPAGAGTNTLVWVDRDGREEPIESAPAGELFWARVSPDGTRIAYHTVEEDNTDVWVSDLTRPGTRIKVTTDTAGDGFPLWTPDGEAVVFQSFREGEPRLFQKAADGTGVAEQLLALEGTTFLYPYEWSPDGEMLLVATNMPATSNDFGVLSMEGEPSWQPLVQTEAREGNPAISPDGQWVAYRSHETGESEVYVAQFPTLEGRQAVSVGGGWSPVWSRDGRELFYQAQGRLMVVPITTEPTFTLGTPEILFEGPYVSSLARSYDLAPDGRFLMVRRGDIETSDTDALTHVVLVQNWFEELNQLVPTN